MSYEDLFKYTPSADREMADTYITLIGDGKTEKEWIEYINGLNPKNIDDRAMLEAISKQVDNMEVRKEATRRLYYTR